MTAGAAIRMPCWAQGGRKGDLRSSAARIRAQVEAACRAHHASTSCLMIIRYKPHIRYGVSVCWAKDLYSFPHLLIQLPPPFLALEQLATRSLSMVLINQTPQSRPTPVLWRGATQSLCQATWQIRLAADPMASTTSIVRSKHGQAYTAIACLILTLALQAGAALERPG